MLRFFGGCFAAGLCCGALTFGVFWTWRTVSVRSSGNSATATSTTVAVVPGGNGSTTASAIAAEPNATNALSAEDLAFGEQQVRRMVIDRPEMARAVGPKDAVWLYCVRAFAGAAINQRIYWNARDPLVGYDGDHSAPYAGEPGYIRIRSKPAPTSRQRATLVCERLWAHAVFELENIRSAPDFLSIHERALRGELNRDQWIRENTELEHAALLRTAKLSETLWQPMAKAKGIPDTYYYWYVDVPTSYEEWIAQYTDRRSYPWDSWARSYDQNIVPYLRQTRAAKGARSTVSQSGRKAL